MKAKAVVMDRVGGVVRRAGSWRIACGSWAALTALVVAPAAPGQSIAIDRSNLIAYYDFEQTGTAGLSNKAPGATQYHATRYGGGSFDSSANPSGPGFAGNASFSNTDGLSPRGTLLAHRALNLVDSRGDAIVVPLGTNQLGPTFTISAWHALTPGTNNASLRYHVFEAADTNNYDVSWGTSNSAAGPLSSYTYLGYLASGSSVPALGVPTYVWHHVAHVFTNSGANTIMTVYLDGAVKGSLTSLTSSMNFTNLHFGRARVGTDTPADRDWDGMLDEISLWTRGLSAAEVTNLYLLGSAGVPLSVNLFEKANNLDSVDLNSSWTPGTAAPGASDVAWFNSVYAQSGALDSAAPVSYAGIKVTTGANAINIDNTTTANRVELGLWGVDMSGASRDLTIQNLGLGADQEWAVGSGRTFTAGPASSLAGAYRIAKTGAGTASIGSSNAYSGGTTLHGGTLAITDGGALGTGALALTNAVTFRVANTSAVTLANDIVLSPASTATRYTLSKTTASASEGTRLDLTGTISGGNANITLYLDSGTGGDNSTEYRFAGNNASMSGTVHLFRGRILVNTPNSLGSAAVLLGFGNANQNPLGTLQFEDTMNDQTFSNNVASYFSSGVPTSQAINTGTNNVTMSGVLNGTHASCGFIKYGAGTLTLSSAGNTYLGPTILRGGMLSVAVIGNGGFTGQLGKANAAATNLVFNGGSLAYTGPAGSSDRLFSMASDGTLAHNGTGALNFTSNGSLVCTGTGHTLTLGGNNTNDNMFAPTLPNGTTASSLTKAGAGTWILTGAHPYAGPTIVEAGTLQVDGSLAGTAGVTISNGATLRGTGTLAGTVTAAGTVSPGDSIGTLSFLGSLAFEATGVAEMQIAKTGSDLTNDEAAVTGALTYGGSLVVTHAGDALASGDIFTLFTAGSFGGWFATVSLPGLGNDLAWDTNFLATAGQLEVYDFTFGTQTLATARNTAATLPVFKLVQKATSPWGDVGLASVSATSASNGTVALVGTNIVYTPPTNYVGADTFTCVLADGHGSITVTVDVTVTNNEVVGGNILPLSLSNGNVLVRFAGISGTDYVLQSATNLVLLPVLWLDLTTNTCPSNGVMSYLDAAATNISLQYYRTVVP